MADFASEDAAFIQRAVACGVPLSVVYDIGASNGYWSLIATKALRKGIYHLFEPLANNPDYAEKLKANLPKLGDATLHELALSNVTGTAQITVADDGYSSSLHDVSHEAGYGAKKAVQTYRLDDLVAEKKLPPPSLIKMDTQGTEHLIVEGGKRTFKSASIVIVESWLYRGYNSGTPLLTEMIALLTPLGFTLMDFGGVYRETGGRLVTIDAYFCNSGTLKRMAKSYL